MDQKSKLIAAAAVGVASIAVLPAVGQAALVINEIYGGGASTNTATFYSQDFIELLNNGTTPIDLTGDLLGYASATGTFATSSSAQIVLNPIQLQPGASYLISGGTNATPGTMTLPAVDQTSAFQIAATNGKLRLLASDGTTVLDLVGYGSTASTAGSFEGTGPAPSPSITTSISRTLGLDANNNALDFTVTTPTPFSTNAAVPEPATLGVAAVAAVVMIGRRRRR